jgi:arylsulfatase A-like enzyme
MITLKQSFRFALGSVAVVLGCLAEAAPARPPNVIVILADDQGWADLGVNGNTQARTPNLDALARSGARFERFFVQPVCAPTRAEFLTGRYYARTGVRGVDSGYERLNADESTLADAFKAAGYATGAFGKWHNGGQGPYHPNARGFDEFYGFSGGHWGWYFDAPLEHNGRDVRGSGYITDDLTGRAIDFVEKNKTRPFFCYLALNTPHSPFCVPDEYWDRWKDADLPLRSPDAARENIVATRAVHAMNENLDWNVGRLLQRLERAGISGDTIVVYFSDNGANTARWNAGMKGRKTSVDEGGVRSPLFVRWPDRVKPGTVVKEIAGAIDLYPTLLRLTGASRVGSKPLDGVDVAPLLLGEARAWPERMMFASWMGRLGVRTPRFRLDDKGALFDLVADPEQAVDASERFPAEAGRLREAVARWTKDVFGNESPGGPRSPAGPRPVAVDARPIPVGHPVHARTELPAGEGLPSGGVQRSNRFPNCTYFTNWTTREGAMTWDLEMITAGDYEVTIDYAAAEPGSTIEVRCGEAQLVGKVAPAWTPRLRDDEDRGPRQESYLKDFRALTIGTMRLASGRHTLTLRALEIAGTQVAEVYRVTLRLRGPQTR